MTTKLLAVDDSKTMRKVLEITFAGNTYDSKIVGSAEEAMASLKESPPQLVVVDGHLGRSSGYELCRQIKAAAPQVKVMLLSSKQRPYDAGQGSAAGVDEHFDKPFDSTKFLDKLGQIDLAAAPAPTPVEKPVPVAAQPAAPPPMASSPSASRPAAPPLSPASKPAIAQSVGTPKAAPVAAQPAAAKPAAPPAAAPKPAASQPAAALASAAVNGGMSDKLGEMGLSPEQVQGVLALSREVVEQVVWEVVPQLAETLIKEEIARLTAE